MSTLPSRLPPSPDLPPHEIRPSSSSPSLEEPCDNQEVASAAAAAIHPPPFSTPHFEPSKPSGPPLATAHGNNIMFDAQSDGLSSPLAFVSSAFFFFFSPFLFLV